MAEAGWYADPEDPRSLRYFDGTQWTEHRQPVPGQGGPPEAGQQTPQRTDGATTEHPAGAAPPPGAEQPPTAPPPEPAGPEPTPTYPAQSQPAVEPTQQVEPQWSPPGQPSAGSPPPGATEQIPAQPTGYGPSGYPAQPGDGGGATPTSQYGPEAGFGGYQQGYGAPAPGYGPPDQYPEQGYGAPVAAAPKRKARWPLIAGLIVVAALIAGGLTYFLWPDKPKLTYQGKTIENASQVLDQAQNSMSALAKDQHAATNGDTRCYYAVPKNPASGQKSTDVLSQLRCGPILFVDGDTSRAYLRYMISGQPSGDSVTLTVASTPSSPDPQSIGNDVELKRPDGKTPPSGDGGLKVPSPPPAAANAIVAATLGPITVPKDLSTPATMASKSTGITVTAAGYVDRYGSGSEARSAPQGQRLIAFQATAAPGQFASDDPYDSVKLDTGSGSTESIPEPDSGEWIVAAVAASGTPKLVLNADGYNQSISLPDGTLGPNNIKVLARRNYSFSQKKSLTVTRRVSNGAQSVTQTLNVTFYSAQLRFWPKSSSSLKPGSTDDAYLVVDMDYNYTGSNGGPFGFDPAFLTLKLPNGKVVKATNVASAGRVLDVFLVPADFTNGQLIISGSGKIGTLDATITTSGSVSISIKAG